MAYIPMIEAEIADLENQIRPIRRRIYTLRQQLRSEKAREFIRVNSITRDSVQFSDGEGVPWFGHVTKFAEWLKTQPHVKPWAEWNTTIYHTSDLIAGRMPDMPATIKDLTD